MNQSILDQLVQVRATPRRMHESYLKKHGLFSHIHDNTADDGFAKWTIKDRIDFLLGNYPAIKCYCGSDLYLKPATEFCSMICAVKHPDNLAKLSKIQSENAESRMEKSRQTYISKYGVAWNNDIPGVRESKRIKRKSKKTESVKLSLEKLGLDPVLYTDMEYLTRIRDECTALSELSRLYFNNASIVFIQRHYLYHELETYPKSSSVAENELAAWIESLGFNVIRNDRTIIKPKEIDIFIPSKNLAIEFDGIYWHSTKKSDSENTKVGHVNKTNMASDVGVNLVHVFESEYIYKPEIVKSIIYNRLGLSNKIYARNTEVREIQFNEAKTFFETTHLQGNIAAKHYIGLFDRNELVMTISIGKNRFSKECDLELFRMSTKLYTIVIGGFSKLMTYVRKHITTDPILTYCDMKISSGNTYAKFGKFIRKTEPGYSWHSFKGWYSRYQTQKHKLAKLVPDHFSPELTEKEIMESAGFYQLYDCGNLVFTL